MNNNLELRICVKCKEKKDLSEYYDRAQYKFKTCKECLREKQKGYPQSSKLKDIDYVRDVQRRSKYNLTKQEFKKLYESQQGKCAICRTPEESLSRILCVDHCHRTGKVRGLLCMDCNQALGKFRDNTSIIEDALYYLILNK